MKFLTRKYLASVVKADVSSISLSEAIDEPRMWKTTKVSCPFFTASRKPISRSDRSVGDSRPARTSITVTLASVHESVSNPHLVGDRGNVDDIGGVGMKPFQRALGRFGVERPRRHVVGCEVIQQRARYRGLADAALVRSYNDHRWLGHGRSFSNPAPPGA